MDNKELIDLFTKYLKANGKTVSTIIAYKKDIEQLSESNISKKLDEFNSTDIKFFLEYLKTNKKLSLKTISRKLNSIRTFFKFLAIKGIILNNPAIDVAHPKFKNKRPRVLNKYEYLALREVCRENLRLYTMIEILLQTGIRISELSRIKRNDIKINSRSYLLISSYSSNPSRKVPLNNKIANIINKYINITNPTDTLFVTKTGKPIEIRNIRSSIDRAIIKAEIKNACINDLRNTFIVYQLGSGLSIVKVAELVGHKNTQQLISI